MENILWASRPPVSIVSDWFFSVERFFVLNLPEHHPRLFLKIVGFCSTEKSLGKIFLTPPCVFVFLFSVWIIQNTKMPTDANNYNCFATWTWLVDRIKYLFTMSLNACLMIIYWYVFKQISMLKWIDHSFCYPNRVCLIKYLIIVTYQKIS